MNAIEKLKALEAAAMPAPWSNPVFDKNTPWLRQQLNRTEVVGTDANVHLANSLRNLAPEILAVLESVETHYYDCSGRVTDALDAFNARATEVLE